MLLYGKGVKLLCKLNTFRRISHLLLPGAILQNEKTAAMKMIASENHSHHRSIFSR